MGTTAANCVFDATLTTCILLQRLKNSIPFVLSVMPIFVLHTKCLRVGAFILNTIVWRGTCRWKKIHGAMLKMAKRGGGTIKKIQK